MLHQIGVGALGPVFRTYEPDRDRLVAVKVFRLDITPEQAKTLADELSRAADAGLFHPSIVEPIAAGVQGSVAYRAEEYVAAESLDVAMRHYAPAPLATVLPFITQLAGAIDFARAAGVGHGGLHPRDIFVTPEEARATGFGVVEALERVGFRAPVRRPYTPPERIAGERWSTPADVFSLAAITYELLTGRRPSGVGGEIGALTSGTPNEFMDALHAVLARAMAADPAARYDTALAFASALEAAGRGQAAAGIPPASIASPPAAEPAVNPIAAAGATAAAAAAVPPAPPLTPPAAAAPLVPPPKQEHKDDAAVADRDEEEDEEDVAAERDEDEAHHALTLEELARTEASRGPDLQIDDDIAAEVEADRFTADDFLLDAAGAASGPAESARRAESPPPIDMRAFADDEVMVDEPPSPWFRPEDLRQDEKAAPAAVAASAPSFGYQSSDDAEFAAGRSSGIPRALILAAGLLIGFAGGYAVWGRSSSSQPPAGREFSEQAVAPQGSRKGSTPPAESAPTTGSTSPAPSTKSASPPASTRPVDTAASAAKPAAPPAAGIAKPKPAPVASGGSLTVRSTPTAAGVTVNGEWRGRTPLTLTGLPLARLEVRVVQPGYVTSREVVTLSEGEPTRALSFRLQQQPSRSAPARATPPPAAAPSAPQTYTGSLYVDSRPRGARVTVDGKPVGVTPLRVPEVRIGSHVVRLELPDHRIWSTTATIAAGQEQRVTGSLERIQ